MLLWEEGRAQAADPENVSPPSEKLQTLAPPGDGRAQAVDLWWFPLGSFRFLEPLAHFHDWYPSSSRTAAIVRVRGSGHCNRRAQQHGSQRLSTLPQSALLCGYAEAFQPSIHNCSRHDLGLHISFLEAF